MSENVLGTFLSQKINKIRWKPEAMDDSQYCLTGSCDEEENLVTLWYYPFEHTGLEELPLKVTSTSHKGDVAAMEFLSPEVAVVSSSRGSVQLIKVGWESMSCVHAWQKLHTVGTDVACFDGDVASVGEDGTVALLTAAHDSPVSVMEKADSCSLLCVAFLKHNELVTGNLRGVLKLWDLRAASPASPLSCFSACGEGGGAVTCVTSHPTQRHLMLAGGHDGAITLWDLRQSTYPVNVLSAHTAPVCEIQLDSERAEMMLTGSWAGELWQWNTAWLGSDGAKHRMEITSLMPALGKPINSVHLKRNRALAAADNHAIYLINNLSLT